MIGYINRLMKCGYALVTARELCLDFARNLSLFDLECFVETMEDIHHVDQI